MTEKRPIITWLREPIDVTDGKVILSVTIRGRRYGLVFFDGWRMLLVGRLRVLP